MAVIEYRITVDADGNAQVVQDVRRIEPNVDTIIFSGDTTNVTPGKKMAILFSDGGSPFVKNGEALGANPKDPVPGKVFLVEPILEQKNGSLVAPDIATLPDAQKHVVQRSNADAGVHFVVGFGKRRTFHFDCGEAFQAGDPNDPATGWSKWGGEGSQPPGGGDTKNGD
jgi:hypothetical protein